MEAEIGSINLDLSLFVMCLNLSVTLGEKYQKPSFPPIVIDIV